MNTNTKAQYNALSPLYIERINIPELTKNFIEELDTSVKTKDTYKRNIRNFVNWAEKNSILAPDKTTILEYKKHVMDNYKTTTAQCYLVTVKQFFKWTEDKGIYPDIAKNIKSIKVDRGHKKDYLTSNQVKKVLENARKDTTIKGLRNYAILSLMFTGGLRTIEVVRANIEDIRTVGDQLVLYIQGKGHNEKTEYIKLPEPVENAIFTYLNTRNFAEPSEPLFTSTARNRKNNVPLTTRTISDVVKKSFLACGYNSEKLTAHSTRHTAVTLALLNGQSLEQVQQYARHQNIQTTLIYAHNLERANNQTENILADVLFK